MNTLAHMIASTLAPYAAIVQVYEMNACVGAVCLANGFQLDRNGEPLDVDAAPVTERKPVTIRSGCFLASGLSVMVAA